MTIKEVSAAIYNHVVTALQGYNANPTISLEQLEDEVVAEWCKNNFVLLEKQKFENEQ